MALLLRATRVQARQLAVPVRAYGTSLPIPEAPAGTEKIFNSRQQQPKYSLSNPKWFGIFAAMNAGVYAGHWFYMKALHPNNPPNPARNPDEARPEKHMHTVDEDE